MPAPIPGPDSDILAAFRFSVVFMVGGAVPNPLDIPTGCPFHPRCPDFMPGHCDQVVPQERMVGAGHMVACHLYEE
jgi:oligopeptide/dipeptide ABC transporter ATP-binding protein